MMDKINKLSLPVVILIASVILGGFFYASQVNKQNSIERQQEIKLQEDRRIEEAKKEQAKKEYIARRKNECYGTYLKERENWNNVVDFNYSEVRDVCVVKYKSSEPAKTKEECGKIIENLSEITDDNLRDLIFDHYSNFL